MKGKILLWDLETGFNLATLFSLFQSQKVIHYSNIQQERYIICGSIKELGDNKVKTFKISDYITFEKDPTDDCRLVADLIEYLSDADALIAHNGDSFDLKYLNTRAVYWGLPPLPNIVSIDTLKIAKKHFYFNSNRLDYLAQYLGVGEKMKVSQRLWVEALNGSKKAVATIAKYNVVDVDVLEKVYIKLAPYAVSALNQAIFNDDGDIICPLCGSENHQSRGSRYTRTGEYNRFQCQDCGHWFQGTRTIRKAGVKSK